MKHTVYPKRSQNIQLAFWFFAIFILLIVISFITKVIIIVRSSTFDGSHRYTIISQTKGDSSLYSVDPENKSIVVLSIVGNKDPKSVGGLLKIPVDGVVSCKEECFLTHNENPSETFKSILLNSRNIVTNLTILDSLRLWFFAQSVPQTFIQSDTLSAGQDPALLDKKVAGYISDPSVSKENATVSVVNGSGMPGLGNRLARYVSNLGATVVSVTSSEKPLGKSTIVYIDKDSYTFRRLSQLLQFQNEAMKKPSLSDIVITIGEDQKNTILY